jgi:hypothetical protein
LSDDLVYLLKKQISHAAIAELPPVDFYRVVPGAYEVKHDKVVSETVEVDTSHEWPVAVERQNGRTLLLQGSSDPNSAFNSLAGDLDLKIPDSETALDVFDFYLKVALGQEFRTRVIGDDLKLESVALEDFRMRFPAQRRRAAFEQPWWKKVPAEIKRKIGPPTARPTTAAYEVRYFLYTQGNVSVHSLAMSRNAAVAEGQSKPLVGHQGTASLVPTSKRNGSSNRTDSQRGDEGVVACSAPGCRHHCMRLKTFNTTTRIPFNAPGDQFHFIAALLSAT